MDNIETTTREKLIDGTPVDVTTVFHDFNTATEQERDIAVENQKRIFQPKFIPFYPSLLNLDLSLLDILLYGFIDFYIPISPSERFYFTNKQLGEVLKCSEQSITNSISKLTKLKLISCKYKIKANGGKIRFVQLEDRLYSNHNESYAPTIIKVLDNKNKINNNKININTPISRNKFLELKDSILKEASEKYKDKNCAAALKDFIEQTEIKDYKYSNYKLAYFKWVRDDKFNKYRTRGVSNKNPTIEEEAFRRYYQQERNNGFKTVQELVGIIKVERNL